MFIKNKIIVSEVTKYTKPIVAMLLQKYNKSTHPEFESELREITGIGWKQIKNYRNHPNPNAEISDNSKIKKFILKQRGKDKLFKVKRIITSGLIASMSVLIIILIYKGFTTKRSSDKENLNLLIENKLEKLFFDHNLKGCKKIDKLKISCEDGTYYLKEE